MALIALFITLGILTIGARASTKADLKHRQARQVRTLHADRGALRFCRHHPRAHRFCRRAPFFRARIRWTTRELAETRALLNPFRVPRWFRLQAECIYSHENGGYGWHADTGTLHATNAEMVLRIGEAKEVSVRSEELGDEWIEVVFGEGEPETLA